MIYEYILKAMFQTSGFGDSVQVFYSLNEGTEMYAFMKNLITFQMNNYF